MINKQILNFILQEKSIQLSLIYNSLIDIYKLNINNLKISENILETENLIEEIQKEKKYNIILNKIEQNKKLSLLKIIRNITNLGLKECKDIIDNIPSIIKKNLTYNESLIIKKLLEDNGASNIILEEIFNND